MLKRIKISLFDFVLIIIGLLVFSAFLAPIVAHFGYTDLAHSIYFVFGYLCHQLDWRSLHAFEYQYAWCTRDTFIWTMFFITGLLLRFNKVKQLKFRYLIIFSLPMLLDGGIQFLSGVFGILNNQEFAYSSSNFLRMLTGSFFGIGLALTVLPIIRGKDDFEKNMKKSFISVFILMIISFIIYLILIWFWLISANNNFPSDFLDSSINKEKSTQEWTSRCDNCV